MPNLVCMSVDSYSLLHLLRAKFCCRPKLDTFNAKRECYKQKLNFSEFVRVSTDAVSHS